MVITTYNEEKNIGNVLKSLLNQTAECRILIVDSESTDNTARIAMEIDSERIKVIVKKCRRGEGRNIGVENAESEKIIFTDADAIPDKDWVERMSKALDENDLVAGITKQEGPKRYSKYGRVELFFKGFEITAPSMNLAVRKSFFLNVGGFDTRFVTAEDIDLNLRLVRNNARSMICRECTVVHNTRNRFVPFMKQAFWNGYGRGQLRFKNREIWESIEKGKAKRNEIDLLWFLRNASAVSGYLLFLINGRGEFSSRLPSKDHSV